ncbi:CDP-alcohol phosphatidyltransferase family protein [Sphingobacterium sp. SRCM116780]|uniref:CDP-alcohol phosphatidyltransferase family protein n=1 Tax=Sphingobacterium sp. SRCM116780 TaxID=2907623 RepID=UPI001F1DAA70|nr:CDP-alcohol phosphatidyltransferase family protein [Sphingobacterium sp. SRCM116780]UIR55503.1 CDP-alcohol phosphatidyltransferase family protein [Sphingobacterium sp. SRCM116780]
MISVYKLKPKFQQLLTPILTYFYKRGVTANQITIASIILSLLIGVLFWFADCSDWLFLALPIGLLMRMALNALDGMMARTYNQTSKKGELLNEIGDVVSDVFVFFPLIKFLPESMYLIVIFIALSIINEMAGLIGKVVGTARRYDGPMGKSDRALLVALYGILAFCHISLHTYSLYIIAVINILLAISTGIRLKKSLS